MGGSGGMREWVVGGSGRWWEGWAVSRWWGVKQHHTSLPPKQKKTKQKNGLPLNHGPVSGLPNSASIVSMSSPKSSIATHSRPHGCVDAESPCGDTLIAGGPRGCEAAGRAIFEHKVDNMVHSAIEELRRALTAFAGILTKSRYLLSMLKICFANINDRTSFESDPPEKHGSSSWQTRIAEVSLA